MSTNIGGYVPGLRFRLNAQNANPKVLSFATSGTSGSHVMDASINYLTYSGSTTGSQYNVQIVTENSVIYGQPPVVNLASSNTGIATVDYLGNVNFVSTGAFNITGYYASNSYYQGQSQILSFVNTSGNPGVYTSTTYTPDPVNVSSHVLLIYNTNSTTSLNLLNYYTGKRPLFSQANILGISVPSGQEVISYSGFTGSIRQPIINYLTSVSGTKPIRYAVFMCDIPTRVGDTNIQSVSYQLYKAYQQLGIRNGTDYTLQPGHFSLAAYQQNTILTSYINFNTFQDCTGYIDRISAGQTGLYLTGNGQNTGYYIDDAQFGLVTNYFSGRNLQPLLAAYPTIPYQYSPTTGNHITTGSNLAGYMSCGTDGHMGVFYATNQYVNWGGYNWYIMLTVDSLNGQRAYSQGNFLTWFSSGAFGGFGGTGYNNCPVGAVGNVEEPYINTSCVSGYLNLWQSGYPFIECAWQSRQTDKFAVFGDPFVTI